MVDLSVTFVFAQIVESYGPAIFACLVFYVAGFVLARSIANTLASDELVQGEQWRYDVSRINELRKVSPFYRLFQTVIQPLAQFNRGAFAKDLPNIARELQAGGFPRVWTAEEYLAKIELQALFLLPLYVYGCVNIIGPPGIVIAVLLTVMSGYLLRRRLAGQAAYRLVLIKRRLPYLLDLITLLMEAGATFIQALRQGVEEFREHPVGVEFGRVLGEMNMGKGRTGSLEALRDRLQDDELTAIIGSIVQGENLGTPLSRIFRTQADVLRLKRSQRAERIAGEAAVQMLLPGIMVMASTVIVILGPFLINFLYTDLF
ncbi:MAG: type II secretion system F family protein [Planctomycetaceae bacterium]|nr:type II secretion system F family protein [Planctomycetaceae bacterium]